MMLRSVTDADFIVLLARHLHWEDSLVKLIWIACCIISSRAADQVNVIGSVCSSTLTCRVVTTHTGVLKGYHTHMSHPLNPLLGMLGTR